MKREDYILMENYMLSCMTDSAHDKEHIYRVLYNALVIAKDESGVDYDVLIAACLLHDIGRKEQFENPVLCHARVGAEKASQFLLEHNFEREYVGKVAHCILCHRYRKDNTPRSLEARILFDADKLDAAGAVGIARTLIYKGQVAEPLYSLDGDGAVSDGEKDVQPSFFQEYKYKLEKLYDRFYTSSGARLAKQRQQTAVAYYESLLTEVSSAYREGNQELLKNLS